MSKAFLLASLLVFASSCNKKKEEKQGEPTKDMTAPGDKAKDPPKDEPKVEEKKLPEVEMVEHDLSPWGKQFAGYVALAPKDAKIEFDDPSRNIKLSEEDFVSVGEAPYWEDSIKTLPDDKDNKNIKKVSDTEVRYERTPPLGKSWLVDILIKVGKDKYSCGTGMTGTFTSELMADRIATICKSIKKK
jgi:hypothetical protein